MPSGSVQAIHVTSDTTAREIIVTFLQKYQIADNPQKFAIYERSRKQNKLFGINVNNTSLIKQFIALLYSIFFLYSIDRKLGDYERPLCLKLIWNKEGNEEKSFVIGENKTGDICVSIRNLLNFTTN